MGKYKKMWAELEILQEYCPSYTYDAMDLWNIQNKIHVSRDRLLDMLPSGRGWAQTEWCGAKVRLETESR